jgi:hypothetical protein
MNPPVRLLESSQLLSSWCCKHAFACVHAVFVTSLLMLASLLMSTSLFGPSLRLLFCHSFCLSAPLGRRSVDPSVCPSVCLSVCPSGCLLSAVFGLTNWNQPPFLQKGLLEISSGPKNLHFPADAHELFKIPTSDFSPCAEHGFVRWRGKIFITHVGSMAGSLTMRLIGRG